MSEYNEDDDKETDKTPEVGNEEPYCNNFAENQGHDNAGYYGGHVMQHSSGSRRKGQGWFVATLVLAAFMAGAVAMHFLPPNLGGAAALTTTPATVRPAAAPTQAATASPLATLPVIGGSPVALSQGVDVPAIAKAVGPAVVGVVNKAKGVGWNNTGGDVEQGSGSGVIISSDGYIVTNNHVIAGADSVSVTLPGGKEVDAKIVGADEQTDLAVLKVEETELTAAPIGNSDQMQVGQTVIAIGNPLGEELAGTVTMGILSARDRELIVDGYKFKLFQTDAAINPGNSGGALVNMNGELIGINNLKSVSAGTDEYGMPISAEGIGFAIPINDAMPVIRQLITNGYIPRPMLGIDASQEITARMAQRYNVPQGILLRTLTQNGPAEKAGIQAGDILTAIDGTAVATLADMNSALMQHNVGDAAKVKIWRNGGEMAFDVTLDGKTK